MDHPKCFHCLVTMSHCCQVGSDSLYKCPHCGRDLKVPNPSAHDASDRAAEAKIRAESFTLVTLPWAT